MSHYSNENERRAALKKARRSIQILLLITIGLIAFLVYKNTQ